MREEFVEQVGHAMWTFTIPKLLRPYFLYRRELLGNLCRAAWETVSELIREAAGSDDAYSPGMVGVVQTASDDLCWMPHVHAIASRGAWDREGHWTPVPYVHTKAAEKLFRHKIFAFLKKEELITQDRIDLLLSWKNSGFSVNNSVSATPDNPEAFERLAPYFLHPPLSLERMSFTEDQDNIHYRSKRIHGTIRPSDRLDPLDFLARLLMHVPEPRIHITRYCGYYSSVSRARRQKPHKSNRPQMNRRPATIYPPPPSAGASDVSGLRCCAASLKSNH